MSLASNLHDSPGGHNTLHMHVAVHYHYNASLCWKLVVKTKLHFSINCIVTSHVSDVTCFFVSHADLRGQG